MARRADGQSPAGLVVPASPLRLPARIAAGPTMDLWAPSAGNPAQDPQIAAIMAWRAAGERWAVALGAPPGYWRQVMDPDVLAEADRLYWSITAARYGRRAPVVPS